MNKDQSRAVARRRNLRRLANAGIYAAVRGACTAAGAALITLVIWLVGK